MYVNSSSYAAPTMVSGGTFGHQVAHNGTSPAPPSAYMAPTLVPNLVFRQNVPVRIWYTVTMTISFTSCYGTFFLMKDVFVKRRSFPVFERQRQVTPNELVGRQLRRMSSSEVETETEAHNLNHVTHCQCTRVSISCKVILNAACIHFKSFFF